MPVEEILRPKHTIIGYFYFLIASHDYFKKIRMSLPFHELRGKLTSKLSEHYVQEMKSRFNDLPKGAKTFKRFNMYEYINSNVSERI